MKLHRLRTYTDFLCYQERESEEIEKHQLLINALIPSKEKTISKEGHYKPENHTDENWINGVANKWAAALFVKNSNKAKIDLAIGNKLSFSDESTRTIVKQQENENSLIIFLDGKPLDGNKLGYPNEAIAINCQETEKLNQPVSNESQHNVFEDTFTFDGYSYTAQKDVKFLIDFHYTNSSDLDETANINWRESVRCPITGFNNRMRATFHLFDIEMEAYRDSNIYITEQITPIYRYFAENYANVTGSEYLGDELPYGQLNANGVRNETLCALQFPDNSFDCIVSLDVLEHVPDYKSAFNECYRVLKSGGKFLWSVPFLPNSQENVIRAEIRNGEIHHILPPEYHGDPLSNEGVLCFNYFGWEMLEQMRKAGFNDAYAIVYHSLEFGYLGGEQFVFVANK